MKPAIRPRFSQQIVNRVAKRGGSIVIPAFAIGRTQTFMYYLRQLEDEKKIPIVPVYVDSPMALSATDLYLKYKEDHDLDYSKLESSGDRDPLNVHEFHLTRTAEESKAINNVKTPCIIVSASGMITGGRVLHHLAQRLPDARNAVIIAGFQAEGTRGRAVQEGAKVLHLFGQAVPVNAEIITLGQFSAHAGKSELLRWLGGLQTAPKKTWLTHGEPGAAQALQAAIKEKVQMGRRRRALPGHRGPRVSFRSRKLAQKLFLCVSGNFSSADLVYTGKTTRGVGC